MGCLLQQKLSSFEENSYFNVNEFPEFEFRIRFSQERRLTGHEALGKVLRTNMAGKNKHSFFYLLSLLGGDTEQNPGENNSRSCGLCQDFVLINKSGMKCEGYNVWFHSKCCGFDDDMHNELSCLPLSWLCRSCDYPNFSNSFLNESTKSLASINTFAC